MRAFLSRNILLILVLVGAVLVTVGVNQREGFEVSLPTQELIVDLQSSNAIEEVLVEEEQEVVQEEPDVPSYMKGFATLLAITIVLLLLRTGAKKFRDYLVSRPQRDELERIGSQEDELDALPEVLAPKLTLALQEGIDQLRGYTHPRNSVVHAWALLEYAVEDAGLERKTSETPTEFTMNALEMFDLNQDALQGFLKLYHVARFTTKDISNADIDSARNYLITLEQGLQNIYSSREATQ